MYFSVNEFKVFVEAQGLNQVGQGALPLWRIALSPPEIFCKKKIGRKMLILHILLFFLKREGQVADSWEGTRRMPPAPPKIYMCKKQKLSAYEFMQVRMMVLYKKESNINGFLSSI